MTIYHVLIGLGGGGAEHLVLELANQNKQAGYKVTVIGITSINVIEDKYKAYGLDYFSLRIDKPADFYTGFKMLLETLRSQQSLVVHAHMFHAVILVSLVKILKPSLRIVFTLHNDYVKATYRRFLLFITKGLRNAEIIFSEGSKKIYQKSNSVVIANGIDTNKFTVPFNLPDVFTCLFIGRLEEQKNPMYLIDLVLKLKDKYNFKINIAGYGSLENELKEKVEANGLNKWFVFLGFRKDIPTLLSESHCLVMPSLWEGMPISILEAGAAGVPIISTPVGSIPSLLNKQNSFLSELDGFHLQLSEVMDNYLEAKAKALKLKGEIFKKFDIKSTANIHHDLYLKVLNS